MKSVFLILFNTKRTLEFLYNQDETDLNIKSIFIFIYYVMIVYLLKIKTNDILFNPFLDMMLVVCIFLMLGISKSLILHKINMWLDGNASYADIQSLIAHASIPVILTLSIIFFCKILLFNILGYGIQIIYFLSWIIASKILIQGFLKYNHSNYVKMLLNISPLILFYIIIIYFSYI